MTTNEGTRSGSGDEAQDHPWPPDPVPSGDDQAARPFTGWAGWSQRVEPVAPGEDYLRSAFRVEEPSQASTYGPECPPADWASTAYPQDPGDAPGASYQAYWGYGPAVGYPPSGYYPPSGDYEAMAAPAELLPRETWDHMADELLPPSARARRRPAWRHALRAVDGLLRSGGSAAEMRRRGLVSRVRTPVAGGHHRVAVLSLKGGVGKTTAAAGLGATLATVRGDRVVAVDANPGRGTLSDRVRLETAATIKDLLNERDQIRRYADVRAFTSQTPNRLEILASDRDPGLSVAFGAENYCDVAGVLERFYSICITDCGTGLLHSAMSGVLRLADQIVVVSSPSVDGARSARASLDWLEAHDLGDLVTDAVVVMSAIRRRSTSSMDLDRLERHFAARCRAVVRVPWDPHLEAGAEVELELLSTQTADAFLALAALVGDGLARPRSWAPAWPGRAG